MISLKNISKVYGKGDVATTVLHEINLEIEEGEFIAIMGPSGSGKSSVVKAGLIPAMRAGRWAAFQD